MKHEFGKCAKCHRRWVVAKLNNVPLCLRCFDSAMRNIGQTIRRTMTAMVGLSTAMNPSAKIKAPRP